MGAFSQQRLFGLLCAGALALVGCVFDATGGAGAGGSDGDLGDEPPEVAEPGADVDATPPAPPVPPMLDAAPPDAEPPRRPYGERCDEDDECQSAVCARLDDDDERLCTMACERNSDCPRGRCNADRDLCDPNDSSGPGGDLTGAD